MIFAFTGPVAELIPTISSPTTAVELLLTETTTVATCVDGEIAYTAQSSLVPKKPSMAETSSAQPPISVNFQKQSHHFDHPTARSLNTEGHPRRSPINEIFPVRSPINELFHTRSPINEHFQAWSPVNEHFPARSPKTEMFDKPWTETVGGVSPERSSR